MLDAALDLAASGWAVFPCKWRVYGENAKAPLTVNGHHDASRDSDVIKSWWARWPEAMIGAPVPVSMLVIDLDPRNNPLCLADLEALAGPVPDTLTAWSGRNDGGRHHYFLRPPGALTSTRLPDGVDLKAAGYCIVPPSLHPATGQPYRWDQRPAVTLPPRLRDLLRPAIAPPPARTFTKRGNGNALVEFVSRQGEGNRNEGLYWAAKRAAVTGVLDDIVDALAAAAMSTGLGEIEVRRTIESARRAVTVSA